MPVLVLRDLFEASFLSRGYVLMVIMSLASSGVWGCGGNSGTGANSSGWGGDVAVSSGGTSGGAALGAGGVANGGTFAAGGVSGGASGQGGRTSATGGAFGGKTGGVAGGDSSAGGTGGAAGGGAIVAGLNNPIVRHLYTADPAALVYKDTFYVYTGHDEASATDTAFRMKNWHVFSSKDMAHWTDHGAVLSLSNFSWATTDAWAGQVVERDGRFYWYVPMSHRTINGFAIGVAVGASPTGPFTDARGSALITNDKTTDIDISWDDIDPSVFVDDDGQAYLYWGNTSCKVVRLASDMKNTTGDIVYLDLPEFTEAPYVNKINGTYYLSYAAGYPETIVYATSQSPLGPFTRRGTLNKTIAKSPTNHQSLVKFRDVWYFVYHTAVLPGGGEFRRSVSIDLLNLHSDGAFGQLTQTAEGITQLDPGPFRSDIYYKLASRAGGRVVDVANGSTASGANVQQSTWRSADSQRWQLLPVGSGVYHVINRLSGHCLEVLNGDLADGVKVQQATCGSGAEQNWRLLGTQSGDYAFINMASGKALGLAQNATGEGAHIAQYSYTGATTHSWQIAEVQ